MSVLKMVKDDTLGRFRLSIQGVADVDSQGPGIRYAREIPDLDLIMELTGCSVGRD